MKTSKTILATMAVALIASTGGTAVADFSHGAKINIAGKQRMLSQRMARAVCYQSIGVDEARHRTMARYAISEFEMALSSLKEGDWYKGLDPETNDEVLGALSFVEGLWGPYSFALRNAATDDVAMTRVANQSASMLKAANEVVLALVASNGIDAADGGQELATMINVAGRQRMLTQRAAKEFCYIAAGIAPEENLESLKATVALFDKSLNGLLNGDASMGLAPPPDALVRHQLEVIQKKWAPLRAEFATVFNGAAPTQASLQMIAENTDTVLSAANVATYLYESTLVE